MARRFCHFCAIQQKQPMTSFCHGLMSRCDKKDTRLHALTKFEAEKISLQMAMSIITIQLTATDWKVGPADAEIVLSEQDYDLCLPNTAIHQDNQGDFVFAVEEKNTVLGTQNVLVRIPVTVLEVGQSQTSIEGAISPEDSIVVQSTRSLEAGSKVRVKNENA
jgi:hypothetical protein